MRTPASRPRRHHAGPRWAPVPGRAPSGRSPREPHAGARSPHPRAQTPRAVHTREHTRTCTCRPGPGNKVRACWQLGPQLFTVLLAVTLTTALGEAKAHFLRISSQRPLSGSSLAPAAVWGSPSPPGREFGGCRVGVHGRGAPVSPQSPVLGGAAPPQPLTQQPKDKEPARPLPSPPPSLRRPQDMSNAAPPAPPMTSAPLGAAAGLCSRNWGGGGSLGVGWGPLAWERRPRPEAQTPWQAPRSCQDAGDSRPPAAPAPPAPAARDLLFPSKCN